MNQPARLQHLNRARGELITLEDLRALGVFTDNFRFIQDILLALGPVTIDGFKRKNADGDVQAVPIYGLEGGLSARKIRQVVRLLGGSQNQARTLSRWLPALSAGLSVAVDDTDTIHRFSANVSLIPQFVTDMFKKWQDSLTINGSSRITITNPSLEVSNTESYLGGFTTPVGALGLSTVDNVKKYTFCPPSAFNRQIGFVK